MSPNNMYRYLLVLLLDPSPLVLLNNKMAFSGVVVVVFFFVIASGPFFFVAFQRRWRTSNGATATPKGTERVCDSQRCKSVPNNNFT